VKKKGYSHSRMVYIAKVSFMYFVDNLKHYSCFRSQYQNKMLNDIMTKDSTHTSLLTQILMTTVLGWG